MITLEKQRETLHAVEKCSLHANILDFVCKAELDGLGGLGGRDVGEVEIVAVDVDMQGFGGRRRGRGEQVEGVEADL